jgi:hypothetical protein
MTAPFECRHGGLSWLTADAGPPRHLRPASSHELLSYAVVACTQLTVWQHAPEAAIATVVDGN